MKLPLALVTLCGVALAAIIAGTLLYQRRQAAAPAPAPTQEFTVKGVVKSLEADHTSVHIAHEDVPGFMPAMTMPFHVQEPSVLAGIAPGDAVRFRLVVTADDSWIENVEKIGSAPGQGVPAEAPAALVNGAPVPDFGFVDQHGQPRRLRDFRGQAVVLTFIYTRCPLPNFCPLMTKNFQELQARFSKEFPGKAHLLSVTLDPDFDTPQVLKNYAAASQADLAMWTFATGTREQMDFVTELFGVYRETANGLINHDLRTALISPEGKLVHVWRSNVWTPFEIQRMLRETLAAPAARPGMAMAGEQAIFGLAGRRRASD